MKAMLVPELLVSSILALDTAVIGASSGRASGRAGRVSGRVFKWITFKPRASSRLGLIETDSPARLVKVTDIVADTRMLGSLLVAIAPSTG